MMLSTLVKLNYFELKANHPEKVQEVREAWLKGRSKHNRVRADRLSWGICWVEIVDVATTQQAQLKGKRAAMAARIWGVREPKVICWYPKDSMCPYNSHTLSKASTTFEFIPKEVKTFIRASGASLPPDNLKMANCKSFYMDFPLVQNQ